MNSAIQTSESLSQECTLSHLSPWRIPAVMPCFNSNIISSQGPFLHDPGPTQTPSWNFHCMYTHVKACVPYDHTCLAIVSI